MHVRWIDHLPTMMTPAVGRGMYTRIYIYTGVALRSARVPLLSLFCQPIALAHRDGAPPAR